MLFINDTWPHFQSCFATKTESGQYSRVYWNMLLSFLSPSNLIGQLVAPTKTTCTLANLELTTGRYRQRQTSRMTGQPNHQARIVAYTRCMQKHPTVARTAATYALVLSDHYQELGPVLNAPVSIMNILPNGEALSALISR